MANFTKAIEIDGTKADFYSNRGFSYRKLKKFKQAIEDYTEAISLNPSNCFINLGHFRAYYYRALCYEKIGNLEKEEKDYKKAL